MKLRSLLIAIVALLQATDVLHAQSQKNVYWTDIIEEAIFSDTVVSYKNVVLSNENLKDLSITEYLFQKYDSSLLELDSAGRLVVPNSIKVTFTGLSSFEISSIAFQDLVLQYSYEFLDPKNTPKEINSIQFTECKLDKLRFDYPYAIEEFSMGSNKIEELDIYLWLEQPSLYGDIILGSNKILKTSLFVKNFKYVHLMANSFGNNEEKSGANFYFEQVNNARIWDNHFQDSTRFSITESEIDNLELLRNEFQFLAEIGQSVINKFLKIKDNTFKKGIGIGQTLFPELYVDAAWDQFAGKKLFSLVGQSQEENPLGFHCSACLDYYGSSDEELARNDRFRELIALYTKFYRQYKEDGDIAGANGAYSELQDLYTAKYKYDYRQDRNLDNWFKWKLNQLLEFYIAYGTSPTRALVISFYIILFFAVFYFFYPSDWDTTSKSKMIASLKSALNKEETGTTKSVINSLGLLFLSFINAITLSLNSFVTLGFGTIPTHGLARYICIVQGFLGWFLLSLFTVALINQVIF